MNRAAYITTSWDDGHPLDLRVAELLSRYGIEGTFYVPRAAQTGTMTTEQIRELSRGFEIGAHTLNHVDLTTVPSAAAHSEIVTSRKWVEAITGRPCTMFCPPLGHFTRQHLAIARRAGFAGVRTVEMLSLDPPRSSDGILLMQTTLQAFPHRRSAYLKNAMKRFAPANLWRAILYGRSGTWRRTTYRLLESALLRGGVFHLWGHSWEIEQQQQWENLEEVLRYLSDFHERAHYVSNGAICAQFGHAGLPANAPQDSLI